MRKRTGLDAVETAAKARAGASAPEGSKGRTSAIVLPVHTWDLLRRVALKRAAAGDRMSVSAVIAALVEKHRDELEQEASGH